MSVLIVGGSRGIGRAIAVGLAEPGEQVFINYLGAHESARETADAVAARGAVPHLVPGDVSTPEGAAAVIAHLHQHTDTVHTLVHSAVKTVTGPLLDADPDAFKAAVETNALSLLYVVRAARPLLGIGSSVIYLSSRGARLALANYASVGVPKAMGEALIRYLSVELAAVGARANTISPTAQDTDAFRSVFPEDHQARLAQAAQKSPSGRAVGFDDIVAAVRFLASPGAAMIQGQTIILDGGSTLVG